jgi:hypothetical protein
MTKTDKDNPNFFEEGAPDPVAAATGEQRQAADQRDKAALLKRKAGFYLSQELLDRFNTKFYEFKLAGVGVENKSGLLERALEFALDDLDRGEHSPLLTKIKT